MTELLIEFLPVAMFLCLFALFLTGYQITFALMATGIIFGLIAVAVGALDIGVFAGIPENIWGQVMMNDTLLAIPFFTLMGLILERCGLAEDLLETIAKLFGPIRGGLAYAVILVGSILAATTGIVAASVMAMGLIALPIMLRYGYDRELSTGTIAASGTLAQIVPPSLVLIVLADQLGRSVGDMYMGAMLPSLLLIGLYCGYIFITSLISPEKLPPAQNSFSPSLQHRQIVIASLPIFLLLFYGAFLLFSPEKAVLFSITDTSYDQLIIWIFVLIGLIAIPLFYNLKGQKELSDILRHLMATIIPPVILIFLVLGTIFQGLATPTEAGAAGAIGALILAICKKRLSFSLLKEALEKTAKLSTFVMFILIGARIFTLTFYHLEGHELIESLFGHIPGGAIGFLIIVNIMIFLLAFFLDFFELVFILVPLLAPIATKLGIDLVWFGVILGLNLQTSFLTPPFGFSLFFLRSVTPDKDYTDKITGQIIGKITTTQIYKGVLPYIVIQLIMVALVIAFPELTYIDTAQELDMSLIDKQLPILPPLTDPVTRLF
ncbi:MAG: TRAP transporter large permease subunit [Pseudomonadota bacterium]